METFEEYCKNFIVDNLDAYVGTDVYGCDLSSTLTEEINVNGSATFSRQKAIDYIKEWFDEAAEVYNYQVENYGRATQNPFENPEAWMVCMIIEGCVNAWKKFGTMRLNLQKSWQNRLRKKSKVFQSVSKHP